MIEAIEAQLGRAVEPAGAITDLNETPPAVIAAARQLSTIRQRAYLRHVVAQPEHPWLAPFIAACIDGDVPAIGWGRGRVVALDGDAPTLLTAPVVDALAPLEALGPVQILAADPALRHLQGAPAVVLPDVDYRWRPPPGTVAFDWGRVALQPAPDLQQAGRRWLARLLRFRFGDEALPAHPEALIAAVLPTGAPSADALAAARLALDPKA